MKGFKEAYKSISHYYNDHGSHENLTIERTYLSDVRS